MIWFISEEFSKGSHNVRFHRLKKKQTLVSQKYVNFWNYQQYMYHIKNAMLGFYKLLVTSILAPKVGRMLGFSRGVNLG